MLFNNLLEPYNPRLTRNSWKYGKGSSCEVGGGIESMNRKALEHIQRSKEPGAYLDVVEPMLLDSQHVVEKEENVE